MDLTVVRAVVEAARLGSISRRPNYSRRPSSDDEPGVALQRYLGSLLRNTQLLQAPLARVQ